MLAFNLLRMPDPETYKEYSTHFAPLPQQYGMRMVAAAKPKDLFKCFF